MNDVFGLFFWLMLIYQYPEYASKVMKYCATPHHMNPEFDVLSNEKESLFVTVKSRTFTTRCSLPLTNSPTSGSDVVCCGKILSYV